MYCRYRIEKRRHYVKLKPKFNINLASFIYIVWENRYFRQ